MIEENKVIWKGSSGAMHLQSAGTHKGGTRTLLGNFPGGPVARTSPSNAEGVGSIPGQGTKTPHASQPKNQKRKQKQYCNKFNKSFKKMVHIKKKKNLGEKKSHIRVEAKHRFSGKLNYKDGFHVLHRKYLPTRRKRFGIQTRGVCTQRLCETVLKPGRGMVNMLVQGYQHRSVRDSDISKGVTTQRRRKNNQFLARHKWVRKDGWDVGKKKKREPKELKVWKHRKLVRSYPITTVIEASAGCLEFAAPSRRVFNRPDPFTLNHKGLYWMLLEINLGLENRFYRILPSLIKRAVIDIKKILE